MLGFTGVYRPLEKNRYTTPRWSKGYYSFHPRSLPAFKVHSTHTMAIFVHPCYIAPQTTFNRQLYYLSLLLTSPLLLAFPSAGVPTYDTYVL